MDDMKNVNVDKFTLFGRKGEPKLAELPERMEKLLDKLNDKTLTKADREALIDQSMFLVNQNYYLKKSISALQKKQVVILDLLSGRFEMGVNDADFEE